MRPHGYGSHIIGTETWRPSSRSLDGAWDNFDRRAPPARRGPPEQGSRSAEPESVPVAGLPLDRASHGRDERHRGILAGREGAEDIPHDVLPDTFRVFRVVELAAVPKFPACVDDEEVGRGHGSVGLRGFLALVAQVREVVSLSL